MQNNLPPELQSISVQGMILFFEGQFFKAPGNVLAVF
jgi:hypothetical protein